jgi:hypothetical protein
MTCQCDIKYPLAFTESDGSCRQTATMICGICYVKLCESCVTHHTHTEKERFGVLD